MGLDAVEAIAGIVFVAILGDALGDYSVWNEFVTVVAVLAEFAHQHTLVPFTDELRQGEWVGGLDVCGVVPNVRPV